MPTFTTEQITYRVGGTLIGPGDVCIHGVEQIERADSGQLTFVGDDRHVAAWLDSRASAVLVSEGLALCAREGRSVIRVNDADLALVEVLGMYAPPVPRPALGIARTATVDPSAELGHRVAIGPGCCIGPGVRLADDVVLHANVTLLDGVRIGATSVLWPGCVVREQCLIGDACILHPNVTVGADGFGFRPAPDGVGVIKIPHIGVVYIGREVEIGAGTCIDRGKFSQTTIGDFTKIDNLCQVGHNCSIGRACVIAGQVGIAGSVTIGDGVTIGGKVAIRDHLRIGDAVTLAGCSAVMNDIPAGETWAGYPARPAAVAVREHAAMRRLPELVKLLKRK